LLSEGVSPPPRLDRLYFLACFHGLGEPLRENEQLRERVKTFLRKLEWTDEDIEGAFQSLERHLTDPQSGEEKIVHDANYSELLGSFGIAKAFTTGGARGQSVPETADIFEHQYLDKVVFQTPAGQRLAEEGRVYAKRFLSRLGKEL
jgi:HD superfamily phosphodiesterase